MTEHDDSPFDVMPCPKCGSHHMMQENIQTEDVHLDKDGEVEEYVPRGIGQITAVWCPNCDEQVYDWEEGALVPIQKT